MPINRNSSPSRFLAFLKRVAWMQRSGIRDFFAGSNTFDHPDSVALHPGFSDGIRTCFLSLTVLLFTLVPGSSLAQEAAVNSTERTKPSYKLTVGKGYTLCEAYLRNLNAFGPQERDPVCDPRPHPSLQEFSEPAWEPMDIWENIELIYQAEMSLAIYRMYPERKPHYEQWREEFESKIQSGVIHPKLKRAHIEFIKGKLESVVAYSRNYPEGCDAPPMERDYDQAGLRWFYYDEGNMSIKLAPSIYWGSENPRVYLLRKGRPVIVGFVTGTEVFLFKIKSRLDTFHYEEFCRYDVDDPARPNTMIVPYWDRNKEQQP